LIDKLSPELRVHLRAPKARKAFPADAAAAAGPAEPPAVPRTELLVEFNGDIADLIAVGFRPRSVLTHPDEGYTIATGILPVDRLTDLAAIDHVVEIEGPQKYGFHLNYSVPVIHADVVQHGSPSRTGRDVVIGIIDSGVDWRHGDFFDPVTKKSRILEIWDQSLDAEVGETVGPTVEGDALGVLYNQDEITQAYLDRDEKKIHARDRGTHGTHVAGIAAGNGLPACCCRRPHTYVGVAPDAQLLVVRLENEDREVGENVRLVDAITYIFNHPKVKGATPAQRRPAVVNISLGQNRGAHDGTAMVERAINAAVATPGQAVVVSAGNHADELCHVGASVPKRTAQGPTELEFEFTVPERKEHDVWVDIWYQRAGILHIVVESPDGETSGTVNHGGHKEFVANPTPANTDAESTVSVVSRINNPFSRDNNWRIHIPKPDDGNVPHGSWTIRLINPGAAAVPFHAWIERGDPRPTFVDPKDAPADEITASPDSTISIPGTATGAITVASHFNKARCCECDPKGDGAMGSSGQGPVARGAATNKKPDIAAPGFRITSAKADARNFPGHCCSCCPDACCELYVDKNGTSMAAPHVTGTIALMFEENPHLKKADVLKHLRASATPPPAGEPPEWWGAGRLNAEKAVEAVRAAGGGGGGHPHVAFDSDGGVVRRRRARPAYDGLRNQLMALPDGVALAAAVSRHFSEVRRLINTNRRVAAMWHRAAGPCLLRELLQGAIHPGGPAALLGGPTGQYLERWWNLLARYGSPRLRTSLTRFRYSLMALLRTYLLAGIEAAPVDRVDTRSRVEALAGA
jgi:subtilisin family serine protease